MWKSVLWKSGGSTCSMYYMQAIPLLMADADYRRRSIAESFSLHRGGTSTDVESIFDKLKAYIMTAS